MLSEQGRPSVRAYILKLKGGFLSEEDDLMINYMENLERKERAVKEFIKYIERRISNTAPGEAKMIYYGIVKDLKKFLS